MELDGETHAQIEYFPQPRRELFVCLYRVWCHHPLAVVSLCLLSQHYTHACELLRRFSEIENTSEFLVEVDKLVQLIESPIFTCEFEGYETDVKVAKRLSLPNVHGVLPITISLSHQFSGSSCLSPKKTKIS